jgi:hypothetical protein
VGGTRTGIKCLHAHYAWFLAGGDDPVGRWVHDHLTGYPPEDGLEDSPEPPDATPATGVTDDPTDGAPVDPPGVADA